MDKPLILVKLGGSLITDKTKPYTANIPVIKRLAREIHEAREEKDINLIVGHGGGSFPHVSAKKYQTHKGVINKDSYEGIAKVQNDAAKLNRIIVDELINAGENAMSIQVSSCSIAENGRIKYMYTEPIKILLKHNMIPVPYGDVGLDLKQGCCILSTEEILDYLSKTFCKAEFKPDKILVCGIVDGIFTDDPIKNPEAEFIPEITTENIKNVEDCLAGSAGIDVTGGMIHKVERLLEIAKSGIESEIINGLVPGNLKKALKGEKIKGTIIKSAHDE